MADMYEMRELPAETDINIYLPIKSPPRMMGLTTGYARCGFIRRGHGPAWQRRAVAEEAHVDIPTNVFFYATGMGSLRTKLQPLTVAQVTPPPPAAERKVTMARLIYGGNWDPEPGAWPRLAAGARRDFKTDLEVVETRVGKLDAKQMALAHMIRTTQFTMNVIDAVALKQYVENGGVLILEAGGGSEAFQKSAVALVEELNVGKLEMVSADDVLLNGTMADSVKEGTVDYRKFWLLKEGASTGSRVMGVKVNGRWGVLYFADDMTSGLLGTNTWGILGYAPESATGPADVVLYAAGAAAVARGSRRRASLRQGGEAGWGDRG